MKYKLPTLPYAYGALEPYIDEATMHVHHLGHHKAYVDKLNQVLEPYPKLQLRVEELLGELEVLPAEIRTEVENNAGGHANHTIFWTILAPPISSNPRHPSQEVSGDLAKAIKRDFGSFSTFKEKFIDLSTRHFSNGWAWLCAESTGGLSIFSTKDHESPISRGMTPLFVMDLWEHAYYLKHQNRRPDYLSSIWNVINWEEVGKRCDEFCRNGSTSREWRNAS